MSHALSACSTYHWGQIIEEFKEIYEDAVYLASSDTSFRESHIVTPGDLYMMTHYTAANMMTHYTAVHHVTCQSLNRSTNTTITQCE